MCSLLFFFFPQYALLHEVSAGRHDACAVPAPAARRDDLRVPAVVGYVASVQCHAHADWTAVLVDEMHGVVAATAGGGGGGGPGSGVVCWIEERLVKEHANWVRPGVVWLLEGAKLALIEAEEGDLDEDEATVSGSAYDEPMSAVHPGEVDISPSTDGARAGRRIDRMLLVGESSLVYAWTPEEATTFTHKEFIHLNEQRAQLLREEEVSGGSEKEATAENPRMERDGHKEQQATRAPLLGSETEALVGETMVPRTSQSDGPEITRLASSPTDGGAAVQNNLIANTEIESALHISSANDRHDSERQNPSVCEAMASRTGQPAVVSTSPVDGDTVSQNNIAGNTVTDNAGQQIENNLAGANAAVGVLAVPRNSHPPSARSISCLASTSPETGDAVDKRSLADGSSVKHVKSVQNEDYQTGKSGLEFDSSKNKGAGDKTFNDVCSSQVIVSRRNPHVKQVISKHEDDAKSTHVSAISNQNPCTADTVTSMSQNAVAIDSGPNQASAKVASHANETRKPPNVSEPNQTVLQHQPVPSPGKKHVETTQNGAAEDDILGLFQLTPNSCSPASQTEECVAPVTTFPTRQGLCAKSADAQFPLPSSEQQNRSNVPCSALRKDANRCNYFRDEEEIVASGQASCCTVKSGDNPQNISVQPHIGTGESFDDMLDEEESELRALTEPSAEPNTAATPNISAQSTNMARMNTFTTELTSATSQGPSFCDSLDGVDDVDFLGGDD